MNLKLNLSLEEIKSRLAPLFDREDLQFAVLFGSYGTDKVHAHSDIDLGFLFENPVDMVELTNLVIRLLRNDGVDVVDLRRASPLMKFAAIRNGRLLYEKRSGLYDTFLSLAFRMYVDTRKLRDAQRASIRIFLESRGLI